MFFGPNISIGRSVFLNGSSPVFFFTDTYGMPSVLYSLRKMSPFSTLCVRVRRSSDNAEQDIGFLTNSPNSSINTVALLAFAGVNDAFVTTWYDQSTNIKNSIQASASAQPKIVSAGAIININGKPSILFDGINDNLQTTTYSVNNVGLFSCQLVEKLNNLTPASLSMTISEAAQRQIYMNYNVGASTWNNYYTGQFNSEAANSNQSLASFYMGDSGGGFYRNNALKFAPNQVIGAGVGYLYIGQYTTGFNANANFQEIILWDADKGTSRITIETDINSYYNVF